MFTKTIAIELGRIAPSAIVIGLHPGTVDTHLSQPFQRSVPHEKLFAPEQAVRQLLQVIEAVTVDDTGKVFDYGGEEIPP
jgi:hypothetical protein